MELLILLLIGFLILIVALPFAPLVLTVVPLNVLLGRVLRQLL